MGNCKATELPAWARGWDILDEFVSMQQAKYQARREVGREITRFESMGDGWWRVLTGLDDPSGLWIMRVRPRMFVLIEERVAA